MPRGILKKFISLLVIATILAASLFCSCLDSHAAEQSRPEAAGTACAADDHCPACPADDHPDADHCASSCFCSCHLPLTVLAIRIEHSQVITDLVFLESFTAMPEVYLPKFIPPQNLA